MNKIFSRLAVLIIAVSVFTGFANSQTGKLKFEIGTLPNTMLVGTTQTVDCSVENSLTSSFDFSTLKVELKNSEAFEVEKGWADDLVALTGETKQFTIIIKAIGYDHKHNMKDTGKKPIRVYLTLDGKTLTSKKQTITITE